MTIVDEINTRPVWRDSVPADGEAVLVCRCGNVLDLSGMCWLVVPDVPTGQGAALRIRRVVCSACALDPWLAGGAPWDM